MYNRWCWRSLYWWYFWSVFGLYTAGGYIGDYIGDLFGMKKELIKNDFRLIENLKNNQKEFWKEN